ncbi:MAG: histidine kinase [Bacteroidota bacterium]
MWDSFTSIIQDPTWLKRKWYHIIFWISYTLFWYLVFLSLGAYEMSWMDIPSNLMYLSVHAGVTYLNFYVLMPRYLHKKRYLIYALLLIGSVFLFASFITLYFLMVYQPTDVLRYVLATADSSLGSVSMTVLITMVIKIVREWRKSQKRNQNLKQENVETELKLLKAQLNPHFMFNAINNIYFLIRKDPDLAEKSLASFSDMLRYQLYECNDQAVLLSKEIEHTSNFIKLAKLRKGDKLDLRFEIQEDLDHVLIAPFLLFPLVENAFKHVSSKTGEKEWIHIQVSKEEQSLLISVSNSQVKSPKSKEVISYGGIGLANLKRRLSLSYPETHQLEILDGKESFEVSMKVPALQNRN